MLNRHSFGFMFLGILVLSVMAPVAEAQERVLGHTVFPNSGPAAAQDSFVEGVLWMHSFEYDQAAVAFRAAQRAAPDFALAYWGEAMTHNHPVWFRQDRDAALEVLGRLGETPEARIARGGSELERAYLEAVEILFGDGEKAARDTLYAEAMRVMHERWPDDENAAAFYSLALLGTSHGGRDIPTYMRAGAVAAGVYETNPEHPGALHYIIHAFDDPIHAPLALRAARRYSGIAGEAPHALHMTTHIFVAMGMWGDVVEQNELASGPDSEQWVAGHYTQWLGYGYLQQGRFADAEALLLALHARTPADAPIRQRSHLTRMRAEYIAATRSWGHPSLEWTIPLNTSARSHPSAFTAVHEYVVARSALMRGDVAAARREADRLDAAARAATAAGDPNDPTSGVVRVMELQLRGLIAHAEGRQTEGVEMLRQALALEESLPFEFGPPLVVVPSGELLGQVLLEGGQGVEAAEAFRATLATAPGRSASLLGLARAARMAGDVQAAARAYAHLLDNWAGADAEVPELAEARAGVAGEGGGRAGF